MSLALLRENASLRAQLADAEARALRFGRQVGELRIAAGEEAGKVMDEIAASNRLRAQLAEAERQRDLAIQQAIDEAGQHRKWTDDRNLLAKDLAEARAAFDKLTLERNCYAATREFWPLHVREAIQAGDVAACRAEATRAAAFVRGLLEQRETAIHRFEENIVALLYVLMRDHLPTGVTEELILRSAAVDRVGVVTVYSAKHLEAYARELARQLRDGKPRAAS